MASASGIFGVVEAPDPEPILTVGLNELEDKLRLPEGTLTSLFDLASNFGQYAQAYKDLTSGAIQKLPSEVSAPLSQILSLIGQAYGPCLSSFVTAADPNLATLLELLVSLEDAVYQLQVSPAVSGLDAGGEASTAVKAMSYQVIQGDTLESIANNVTGDPAKWVDIARYNDLNLGVVGAEATLTDWIGRTLFVPVQEGTSTFTRDPAVWDAAIGARALGRNFSIQLSTRTRLDGTVDIDVLNYTNNLLEGLSARLDTALGSVLDNPEFGSYLPLLFGHDVGQMTDRMLAVHLEATLLADPRVEEVLNLQLTRDMDAVVATFQVKAINSITTNQLIAAFNVTEAALLDSTT